MDFHVGNEDPPILKLNKWGPSQAQIKLSEFREAFISPTRQILLLLSYQCEALLLPLMTGDSHCNNLESDYDCHNQNPGLSTHYSQASSVPTKSDLIDDVPCTSGSGMDVDTDSCIESKSISDVNSLAWGACDDTYNHHDDASFRELLFVSGKCGVTVHAFSNSSGTKEMDRTELDGKFGHGRWVEWGPFSSLAETMEVVETCSLNCEVPDIGQDVNRTGRDSEPYSQRTAVGDVEMSRGTASTRWLQSFFTGIETIKSDGNAWTKFPKKSSFPCSAKVVSFNILNGNPPLDFLSKGTSFPNKESWQGEVLDSKKDASDNLHLTSGGTDSTSDALSDVFGVEISSLYRCSKVFSSSSHHLVGFSLTLTDLVSVNTSDENKGSRIKSLLLVGRLDSWGIQWVSLVKLDESVNTGLVVEWVDFQFSDDILVCLSASGLILLYAAMTGEYVTHLDVLRASGLNPQSNLWEQEKLSLTDDIESKQVDEVHDKFTLQHGDSASRRIFKRLIVASHTSLLAVVDEFGVIYVISTSEHVPDKYSSYKEMLPHFQNFELGMLVGWEVGASDIGHQMAYSNFSSRRPHHNNLSMTDGGFPLSDKTGNNTLQQIQDPNFQEKEGSYVSSASGFSAVSKTTIDHDGPEKRSHVMRKVFIPNSRFSEDDCICFSPFGITRLIKKKNAKNQKASQLVHINLHVESGVYDGSCLNIGSDVYHLNGQEEAFVGEAVGCTFQGCFYMVREDGLFVYLPSLSISPNFLPVEYIGYQHSSNHTCISHQVKGSVEMEGLTRHCSSWKIEILDRVLLYEGTEGADYLCLENGWDLKVSRIRRLQMALDYLKFDEIEGSLEMLVGVNLEEEGVLRLLFAAVYLMLNKGGNDNEVSAASRLLGLATCFATKMIRKYGLLHHKMNTCMLEGFSKTQLLSLPPVIPVKEHNEMDYARKLREMAHFLEIIRNLQHRLSSKFQRPTQGLVDGGEPSSLMSPEMLQDESQLSIAPSDSMSLDIPNQHEVLFPVSLSGYRNAENLALLPVDSRSHLGSEELGELYAYVPHGGRRILPLENPKETIARWKIDNLDLKTVVKDALLSGRLPLAVLQLHLHHSRDMVNDKEPHDTFTEVRDIGRAIAYDLFLKGETELAVATLQRLGEDIETSLKQLIFGTVRRYLRMEIAEEMKKNGYLGTYEWKILDKMALLERLYPSSGFWKTYLSRQKEVSNHSNSELPVGDSLHLLDNNLLNNHIIECGDVDGVVLGSWMNISESSSTLEVDEDNAHIGYWAAAAAWFNAWDQRTVDRMILDQSFPMGIHVMWESQLEYHLCRNNWEEVSKLLDLIPTSILSAGSLQVSLDAVHPASTVGCKMKQDYGNFLCSLDDLDSVCMEVPDVKILRFLSDITCSVWLRMLMEEKLAKKLIFLKEYWEGTMEMVPLLARSGFVCSRYEFRFEDDFVESSPDKYGSIQALHKLIVYHCAIYNLPNLLDLYLDHHNLVLDNDSLGTLQEAAGDCQWARWLLLSRIKGCEYEASLANARTIMSRNLVPGSNLSVLEIDEIIRTVDDIAEGGSELAALATLMYASAPYQNCLNSGSVNRHSNSSAQCTLENLRPTLQQYPTLWRTLVAACFGQDTTGNILVLGAKNALAEYLNWRDNIFFSTGRDTSLLQMLPYWFPKAVRRLIHLYVQGPLGFQSLSGLSTAESLLHIDIDFFVNADVHPQISAVSWEASIQKHIEEELYDSSIERMELGIEHHLNRGRALAAFNHILSVRVQKLKTEGESGALAHGQTNIQSDLQRLLSPITQSEESLLSSVIPLAIMHFEDSMLVASCAFLLELCGLSASMLRVDVVTLRRIASFCKSREQNENLWQFSPKGSIFHAISHEGDVTESLARALADDYSRKDSTGFATEKGTSKSYASKRPSRALTLVLHHLEKASFPQMVGGSTCGSWLLSGNGDGTELRSQQKAASQYWSLVTVFCRIHQLPLSTKYLAVLARDNDWVGFLSEAQVGGYPFDTVLQVASKEFSDPRLKFHISTVLKGMQSKKATSSSYSDDREKMCETSFPDENRCIPIELFQILAECEKQRNPGEALLMKAKDLSWSILAMVASCFPDVSPLSCLTIWLEITAARETSSIKVNDIASQIADNVGAAVEATNALPAGSRVLSFHYNRRNPKRRRLMEPISVDSSTAAASDVSSTSMGAKVFFAHKIADEEERKQEISENTDVSNDSDEVPVSLSKMVAVLCEQHLFLPLLRAFEMFLPSCSLLSFIRALQAFSQMRLSEASAHLGSFSARIKEEPTHSLANLGKEGRIGISWISSTAMKASDAMLSTCPSPYEKRCLLQLLAATDFGDGGSAATYYRRLYWQINLAEPLLRKDDGLQLGNESLDDASLLSALEKSRHWEQARNWAKQLQASGGHWKSAVHHVTETQAESMVTEWKEYLWDVPEERVALWGHCQTLFIRYSFPSLQAGLFFLKHAEAVEKDLPATELHELLLLSLQWLSGMISLSNPVYPLHLLREVETKVWLLAVESETQVKSEGDINFTCSGRVPAIKNGSSIIDRTASIITKMDNHINAMKNKTVEKYDGRENNQTHHKNQVFDGNLFTTLIGSTKTKRRAKGYLPSRRPLVDSVDKGADTDDGSSLFSIKNELQFQEENFKVEMSFSRWEERVGAAELERAVLSLLEFGQITAAKQLQYKLSPGHIPSEFRLVDAALKLAAVSTPPSKVSISMLDEGVLSVMQSYNLLAYLHQVDPIQVLESLAAKFTEGSGRGLCKRIIAVVKAANILGLSFSEAFDKQPIELLQLLSLKAQESFEEANLLVQTHSMPPASIAQILAESFLKGLLAAHRGGYMESQKEEGPAPLLWRFSDFLKWAELCPSEPEIGHALMRLVITGQEIPHACEVELLILSHHFYKSSACLDGVDVLVALAATRVEAYVSEGDFPCLARLITGVGNFHALNFILGILIENGQLDLLLQKYSAAADTNRATAEAVRGFRMAVLTSLKHFNSNDLDAFAMAYNHFDMKHETAALLESRADQSCEQWFRRYDNDQNEDLLDSMRYFIEAAEVHSSIDAGNKTRKACAQASLLSLQIRMPDFQWLYLSETNARRALVEQSRFQEALIVAEAYGLNQPSEWALVLWNHMLKPEVMEEFVAEFVAVLPLQSSMLIDLARFYRAEVAARGDQSQFSVWLTGGGLPAEWAKYLGRSFRCLLKRTRDLKLRLQLATVATGFEDVTDACLTSLDKVPDNAAPLVLRKGHGGTYLPLM
ncbi:Spatacsin [Quillaja saponaria]|uniref:Spatacsin n=1 Tax=Quillaja saponaria TaxID=32244 RepID=A0AAD7P840_QUISA|nr:Spatacsin [Quillaja saponaria]